MKRLFPTLPDSELPLVTFIQPYVPEYRVPFFDELAVLLEKQGLALAVAHGAPLGGQAARGDARLGPWSVPIRIQELRWLNRTLRFRPILALARSSAVVVAELASTNLDAYVMALDPRVPLMLWGHGSAYVTEPSRVDAHLEMWLAHRATRVFTYTEGGAEYLRRRGYDAERLTVVRNSTDTAKLRLTASALTNQQLREFRATHGITDGPVISFVGSYDESKCLPLLVEAADIIHDSSPEVQILLAGAGPLQGLVDDAVRRRPFMHSLPRTDSQSLGAIGRISDCFVIPGRVGLVAVDAVALGRPVVTTDFPHHAPEFEYLPNGVKFVANRTGADLAREVLRLIGNAHLLETASRAALRVGDTLSIQAMAAAFSEPLSAAAFR